MANAVAKIDDQSCGKKRRREKHVAMILHKFDFFFQFEGIEVREMRFVNQISLRVL